jgi:hypothetical protein
MANGGDNTKHVNSAKVRPLSFVFVGFFLLTVFRLCGRDMKANDEKIIHEFHSSKKNCQFVLVYVCFVVFASCYYYCCKERRQNEKIICKKKYNNLTTRVLMMRNLRLRRSRKKIVDAVGGS